jgi:hypothetical protein
LYKTIKLFKNWGISMKVRHIILTTALFALPIVLSLTGQSFALINRSQTQNDKGDLEERGYKCERIATNFTECTKNGSPTYWCTDNGSCEEAPKRSSAPTRMRIPTYKIQPVDRYFYQY